MSYETGHYYTKTGEPMHWVPKKDGKGNRPTTIADARKLGLLPSVTTILKVLAKPQLQEWIIKQNVMAALTTPRLPDETLDQFMERVMAEDANEEAHKARDLGSDIHAGIEAVLGGGDCTKEMEPYVNPAIAAASQFGRMIASEKVVIGDGYAGRVDMICEGNAITVIDFKSTGKPPKASYLEHKLQLAAYARTLGNTGDLPIQTANIYVSSKEPGIVTVDVHTDWMNTYTCGFLPLLTHWQWAYSHKP